MKQYHELLRHVLEHGEKVSDRTGVGTTSVFGYQYSVNLNDGFPLLTTKKLHWKSIAQELLWFLKGDTNIKYLNDRGVTIWDEWGDEEGELGPVYGKQWRKWDAFARNSFKSLVEHRLDDSCRVSTRDAYIKYEIDQIANLIREIQTKPTSRRMMVSAWNPADVTKVALPWCHAFAQFNVKQGKLSCHMYQRSADSFLGVPYNLASYALLTHMIAKVCNLGVGKFIHSFGDLHIYSNHMEQVALQLSREPLPLPTLTITDRGQGIDDFLFEDFVIDGYTPYAGIKAEVAV